MRLIDADALIDILRNSHESHAKNSREESLLDRDIRLVQEQAKYHPIIIEERPHGEWRDFSDDGYVECPFCEHATTCNDDIEELHFCFFCGADMRDKKEDLAEIIEAAQSMKDRSEAE